MARVMRQGSESWTLYGVTRDGSLFTEEVETAPLLGETELARRLFGADEAAPLVRDPRWGEGALLEKAISEQNCFVYM